MFLKENKGVVLLAAILQVNAAFLVSYANIYIKNREKGMYVYMLLLNAWILTIEKLKNAIRDKDSIRKTH